MSAFDVEDYDGSGYDQSDGDPRSEALIGPYSESVFVVFVCQSRSLCDLAGPCVRSNMVHAKNAKAAKTEYKLFGRNAFVTVKRGV